MFRVVNMEDMLQFLAGAFSYTIFLGVLKTSWTYWPMPPNMTYPVHPAAAGARTWEAVWEMLRPPVFATPTQRTDAAYPC